MTDIGNEASTLEERLLEAATRFRIAMDAGGFKYISLQHFPRGSCGDAAELLGEYLRDRGFGDWTYWNGFRPADEPFGSHAWVAKDGILIDVTADQFSDVTEPVIVTSDWSWHNRRFPSSPGRRIAGLSFFNGPNLSLLRVDYELVLSRAQSRGVMDG
jgi:hypothetical protein